MSDLHASGPTPVPGWYPDPSAPVGRTGRRWWDGSAWTGHVVADPIALGRVKDETTPDGQPLARWGRRLAAYAIDGVITLVVVTVLGFPLLRSMVGEYVDYFEQTVDASGTGARPPGQLEIYSRIYPQLLGYVAITLVVLAVYHAGSLRVWSATPGKLAVGLRVRLRETPGRLPWSTIARRVSVFPLLGIAVGAIPLVGTIGGLLVWLDVLWPLWDDKRQALHDRFARTSVVRSGPAPAQPTAPWERQ